MKLYELQQGSSDFHEHIWDVRWNHVNYSKVLMTFRSVYEMKVYEIQQDFSEFQECIWDVRWNFMDYVERFL